MDKIIQHHQAVMMYGRILNPAQEVRPQDIREYLAVDQKIREAIEESQDNK